MKIVTATKQQINFISVPAMAGFPSPADDYLEGSLDLSQLMIYHPAETYLFNVKGNSMVDAHIDDGDMLLVDRAIKPQNGDLVLAKLDGGFVVKKYFNKGSYVVLASCNKDYEPIRIEEGREFEVFGKVTFAIRPR